MGVFLASAKVAYLCNSLTEMTAQAIFLVIDGGYSSVG